jgi:stage II sporulation protein D
MLTLRRAVLLLLTVAMLAAPALVAPAPTAQAASGYSLRAGGDRVAQAGKTARLTVALTLNATAVKKATAALQYRSGSSWVTEKTVQIRSGKGAVKVKHPGLVRTYRFSVSGKATSKAFVVRFVASRFSISGSGYGHGVGMAQWGAYQLARSGWSTDSILTHYYPGTARGTANNNARTVKVQVLGPPADSRTSTTITLPGGFTVTGDGTVLASFGGSGTILIGISGSKVAAKVTSGSVKNKSLALSSRLALTWTTGPVTVAGAQGSYQYGNLQVTAIGRRPNVVDEVAMNTEYLYGVEEMPSSWGNAGGGAALRAQVIAARNYIINQVVRLSSQTNGVLASCDCQVYDDTRSQNFVGWKKAGGSANLPWITAVNATISGSTVQVLRDPSAGIAETPYFASSGSRSDAGTAANADVFGSAALSYLTSVADPSSAAAPGNPYRSWTRTLTASALAKVLGSAQPLVRVEISARYAGGLVKSVRYTTSTGREVILTRTAEAWRTALGLPGDWIGSFSGR